MKRKLVRGGRKVPGVEFWTLTQTGNLRLGGNSAGPQTSRSEVRLFLASFSLPAAPRTTILAAMATFSPILRQLGCLRSIAKPQSLVSSQIARRSLTTVYTPKQEPVPLPSKLPKSFLSQIPPRQQPTNGISCAFCSTPVAAVRWLIHP